MQSLIACFIGLMLSLAAEAEPVVEGQVRLAAGESVAGAQVRLFDLENLRRGAVAQATTDAAGTFVLWLGMRPAGFGLGQNYPNPFNPSTIIPYELAAVAQVRLEVFNSVGQRVATLVNGEQPAGAHRAQWNGTDAAGRAVAAGVYLYRLTADGTSQTGRMVLVDGQAGFDKTSTSSVEPLSPQRAPTASWAEPVEAHPTDAAYGLVVSGAGLATYVDADFHVAATMGPVVEMHRAGRGKATQTRTWILGDVDNTGRVTLADALLVIAYSLDPSIAIPNNGAIWLGDVNGDGRVDGADAQLIEQYSRNPSSHLGIGKRLMLRPVPARIVGRLGDVDNNQRVTLADALLVTAYSLDPSIEVPDGGAIWLGDVNGDSRIDGTDAQLIEQYSRNANAAELPDGMGELVTIGPIIGPIQPPVEPVEPPPAGLLTIPPVTLTVGSSYVHLLRELSFAATGAYYISVSSSDPAVVVVGAGLTHRVSRDRLASEQWTGLEIRGERIGTAEVRLEGALGAQTIPVRVVERPDRIDSVTPKQPKTENITLVFYTVEGVLDPIEERIPWYFSQTRSELAVLDLVLDWLGFADEEIEKRPAEIEWVEYAHSDRTYSISKQPLDIYRVTSGLHQEAFVVLQDAQQNVLQDVLLSLIPGVLAWPATAISIIGDIQMYLSILDTMLAGKLKSTKVELRGLFAQDGAIIPGNSYIPFLMMQNDEADATDIDLRLNVMQELDIESADKKIRSSETIDFGPLTVQAETGYQILSSESLVFTQQAGKALRWVDVQLETGFYNQRQEYRVRAAGPSLTVEEVWAAPSIAEPDTGPPNFSFQLRPDDQFTLAASVLNRSETQASSASASLLYYCSTDPTITAHYSERLGLLKLRFNQLLNLDLVGLFKGLVLDADLPDELLQVVEVEPLDALGETLKTIQLPAPRAFHTAESAEVRYRKDGTCWVSDLSQPVYYGACISDEVEDVFSCAPGVPVHVSSF